VLCCTKGHTARFIAAIKVRWRTAHSGGLVRLFMAIFFTVAPYIPIMYL
jgi:hypothetical protein